MSSLAEISAPSSRRSPLARVLLWLLFAVLAILAGAAAYAWFVAYSALPQLDGRLQISGLSAAVTVTRDSHGVPDIEASSLEDLFFAQGYVTAQDRLWQMDVMRRYGAGELSEILGEDTLKIDREQRILGLRAAARKSLQMAGPRDRAFLEAYARGVNAYIGTHGHRLPIEFRILGYAPKPWLAEDSVVIANVMVKDLNYHYFFDALAREKILAKLGPELTADLYLNRSWHDRPPTVMRDDLAEPQNNTGDSDDDDDDDDSGPDSSVTQTASPPHAPQGLPVEAQPVEDSPINGSNDWVISGVHTVTGKPLLANDMHLGHQMPNLWYEAHLHAGTLDVAGVTLPGMPYVIVGHNQRIAWGFTNVGPTVTDVYIESFNQQGEYQTPGGWMKPEQRVEIVHVKGKPDVTVDVKNTRHGPIIAELVPGETRPLALRWTLYDGLRMPFFDLNAAQNWEEFRHAFSQLDAPGQNVVYADIDGNIGYQATGKIPIRAAGDGSLPVSGADNAHEWVSYIPFEKLPSIYNPSSGIIATANGRITPDGYPNSISMEWEAPWRTERIYHVLESGRRFSAADMLALENDIHSEADLFAAERLVYAVDHASKPSARAKQAADLMRGWDGRMLASSAAPTITEKSMRELQRLLLEPKLGSAPADPAKQDEVLSWKTYAWEMQSVWLENILIHHPKSWLPDQFANYDELLTAAVEATVNSPQAPKDLASWRWGAFNAVEIQHPILGKIPVLKYWAGPGVQEQSGSRYTVKAVSRHHGPSERFIANLADLDQSTLNTVTGQSGNFLSPSYMDQWNAWYEGTTFNLPFSKQAVEAAKTHQLLLEPGR
ncbi:Penicillin amidase [Candidatus Sulfotelmatobacter kueseliae]|uniref:Penicillin amidase n=1 Tax=Candidatus Sulfotelmatobacter kueseliae TaxID=2042962 RepID=A0A2U3K080_9BACT|nr:Penicillin amidase [Candidatus Sulfotelmatobacter kueseliae]